MTGVRVVRGEVRGVPLLFTEIAATVVEGGGARLMIAIECNKRVKK